jgi:septum formation protein
LARLFEDFNVLSPNVDERSETLPLEQRAIGLAVKKARAGLTGAKLVIGADTIVGLGDIALGKPGSADDARTMLTMLSNTSHRVITGVAIVWPDGERSFADVATVRFRALSAAEIDVYIATAEPMDKAGAYAIQGGAAGFAETIEGDVDTVIGLPVARLANELTALGLAEWMV